MKQGKGVHLNNLQSTRVEYRAAKTGPPQKKPLMHENKKDLTRINKGAMRAPVMDK